jgi:hypothetical protein
MAALALQDQWAKLVLEPLAKVGGGDDNRFRPLLSPAKPIVLVIDALDECDRDDESAAILGLLALGATGKEAWLRILLTSRPETPIRYGIQRIPAASLARLVLHELNPPSVYRDIATYLSDNLRCLGAALMLGPCWPSQETIDRLVNQAGGLFIWAVTAYRYISRGGVFANDRLLEVLGGANDESAPQACLDRIYLTVLCKAVDGNYREREKRELHASLHTVLATIAVLAAPLDRHSLSEISATTTDVVNRALPGLQSIIHIPEEPQDPVRLHHASFRDFIVDPSRCNDARFSVHQQLQHETLAGNCLRLMSQHLREDICGLQAPGIRISQIDRRKIDASLRPALQYACRHWGHHVQQAAEHWAGPRAILTFLHEHLLHWLEALSLIGELAEAVHVLSGLEQLEVRTCFCDHFYTTNLIS